MAKRFGFAWRSFIPLFKTVNAATNNNANKHFNENTNPTSPTTSDWDPNWDRREPAFMVCPPPKPCTDAQLVDYDKEIRKATPTASRHLILVRHGQYFESGQTDRERFLTSLGREQADLTGRRLASLELPYTSLTSSTMTRALETAKHINKHLPDLVNEPDHTLIEGAPVPPYPPTGSYRPEHQFFVDGARIESAFRKYFYRADPTQEEDSFDIIVGHANVIRYFICRALQFPPEAWLRLGLANCSVTLISIEANGRVVCEMMGDHGHMPSIEQITFTN